MNINEQIKESIINKIADAHVTVTNRGGGHFRLSVVTVKFEGKSMLAKHKLVLSAIAPLMSGPNAPVHAIDSLETLLPTA
ncbi:MAG: stress-induced morphogen [Moritella dasanensis]|jgi:stress-induced morphogen